MHVAAATRPGQLNIVNPIAHASERSERTRASSHSDLDRTRTSPGVRGAVATKPPGGSPRMLSNTTARRRQIHDQTHMAKRSDEDPANQRHSDTKRRRKNSSSVMLMDLIERLLSFFGWKAYNVCVFRFVPWEGRGGSDF
eukprot:900637-Amphidinium_carterae.1